MTTAYDEFIDNLIGLFDEYNTMKTEETNVPLKEEGGFNQFKKDLEKLVEDYLERF